MTTSAPAAAPSTGVAAAPATLARSSTFRPDIQGLRALAVVAVILDHADVAGFSGGFVGVDVFFVISGFLITQLLLNQAQRTGTISPVEFYSRRARRILPAATVVLVATVLASVTLLGFVQSASVIRDSIWSTFFAANVHFGQEGTDYFAADDPASPVQHFWSLAVEEQFYLVWPLLLLALIGGVAWWRRRSPRDRRPAAPGQAGYPLPVGRILAVLVVLGGASLVYAISLTDRDPTAAYFSTPARAWELALGAVCAVLVPTLARLPAGLRAAMGWVGLGAVGLAIFTYSSTTVFPGRAALLPVVGTALLIAGGVGVAALGPGWLLSRKGCRLVGDWSYSLYLWHWPLLIIGAGYLQHTLNPLDTALLLAATVVVSAVTYRYVENPFRRARYLSRRQVRGILLYPTAIVVTLAACLLAHEVVLQKVAQASAAPAIAIPKPPPPTHGDKPGRPAPDPTVLAVRASVAAAKNDHPVPGHLNPSLLDLRGDVADVGECEYQGPDRPLCLRGDLNSDRIIIVFGDSHARAWVPAVDAIAEKEHYAAYYLVKPGCNAALMTPDFEGQPNVGCLKWRQWAMGVIESLHPDVLIAASDVPPSIIGSNGELVTDDADLARAFGTGLARSMEELRPHVGRVIILGDPPGVDEPTWLCLSGPGADLGDCAFPRSARSKLMFRATRHVASTGGYQFVNPIHWFCADGLCPSVIGPDVAYRDTEHITPEYAIDLVRPLATALHLSSPRP